MVSNIAAVNVIITNQNFLTWYIYFLVIPSLKSALWQRYLAFTNRCISDTTTNQTQMSKETLNYCTAARKERVKDWTSVVKASRSQLGICDSEINKINGKLDSKQLMKTLINKQMNQFHLVQLNSSRSNMNGIGFKQFELIC